jgi:hypothetical protein
VTCSSIGNNSVISIEQTADSLSSKLKAEGIVQQVRPASGRYTELLEFPELLRIAEAQGDV